MIQKLLLSGVLLAAPALMLNGETKVYTMDELGDEVHVSSNGKYVSIGDYEQSLSYIWKAETPNTFLPLPDEVVAYDVDNNGTVVGTIKQKGGLWRPCILVDGEWQLLPCHASVVNTAEANCISADGSVIAGVQFINDPSSEIGGRYYPCIWKKNNEGKWDLTAYTNIKLPDHQGFMTRCLYVNGDDIIIGGRLYCGIGSDVPALIVNGELKFWNKLESKREPFMFQGKYIAYDDAGKQYRTEDPNDPNIYYCDYVLIDGYRDGETGEYFGGEFTSVDAHGNFYGYRTRAFDVDEDGYGNLVNGAVVYNHSKDEWVDDTNYTNFAIGFNDAKIIFPTGDRVIVDGEKRKATSELGFTSNRTFTSVQSISDNGKVIGAITEEMNSGTGQAQYFPFIIVLDEPLSAGIDNIISENGISIIVFEGRIDVAGAENVAVYDLNGRLAGSSSTSYVAPGVYVVKAGDITKKILVK